MKIFRGPKVLRIPLLEKIQSFGSYVMEKGILLRSALQWTIYSTRILHLLFKEQLCIRTIKEEKIDYHG